MKLIKEILLLWRDKLTGWWLLEVCDCPEAAKVFAETVAKQIGCDLNRPLSKDRQPGAAGLSRTSPE